MAVTTILPEVTLTFAYDDDYGAFAAHGVGAAVFLTEGETYKVIWDESTFTCVAFAVQSGNILAHALGNPAAIGGEDNEMPFILACNVENGGTSVFCFDKEGTHTLSITQGEERSVIVRDFAGRDVLYAGVEQIALNTNEGDQQFFTKGALLKGVEVDVDFSEGDMLLQLPDGYLANEAVIKKPENLKPDNIKKGETVAGIEGAMVGNPEEITVDLDFASGLDQVVTPSTEDKLISKVTINKPKDLIPEHIAENVNIAGVQGSFKGAAGELTGRSPESKPIRFYNAYGDVVYGFTRAEIQGMDALPDGPALTGLTFDKWTHTLDELKSEVYFADVGPMYKKNNMPAVVMIVETLKANQKVCLLYYSYNINTTVYWGDGGTSSLYRGTSGGNTNLSHTYTTAGTYVIAIPINSSAASLQFGYYSTYYYSGVSYTSSVGTKDDGFGGQYASDALVSFLSCSYDIHTQLQYIHSNIRLKFVSLYYLTNGLVRQFQNCPALKTIAGKPVIRYSGANEFRNTVSLERVAFQKTYGSIAADTFVGCDSMKEVMYGNSTITDATMNSKWAMLMTSETPPTVKATSPKWGTYPIYVPYAAVEAYKTAAGWSDVAAYIFPAGEYPD